MASAHWRCLEVRGLGQKNATRDALVDAARGRNVRHPPILLDDDAIALLIDGARGAASSFLVTYFRALMRASFRLLVFLSIDQAGAYLARVEAPAWYFTFEYLLRKPAVPNAAASPPSMLAASPGKASPGR